MNEFEMKVHRAIIDLYELYDFSSVDLFHIAAYLHTGDIDTIRDTLRKLENDGVLQLGARLNVVICSNAGYFPTQERRLR